MGYNKMATYLSNGIEQVQIVYDKIMWMVVFKLPSVELMAHKSLDCISVHLSQLVSKL